MQVRGQRQQLIVWLGLQPRSQLIKMLATGDPDEQLSGALTQHAIQCYTQNEIAGAAQATGRDARQMRVGRQGIEGGIAGRQAFEDDAGRRCSRLGIRTIMVQL